MDSGPEIRTPVANSGNREKTIKNKERSVMHALV